eukprot:scaffold20966_cov19-Tisochrysis_lutea.AAC.1
MDLSVRPCTPNWQAAAINAELLARRQENVLLLLALLEDEPVNSECGAMSACLSHAASKMEGNKKGHRQENVGINDFYVRYHTVQLLTVLLQ